MGSGVIETFRVVGLRVESTGLDYRTLIHKALDRTPQSRSPGFVENLTGGLTGPILTIHLPILAFWSD